MGIIIIHAVGFVNMIYIIFPSGSDAYPIRCLSYPMPILSDAYPIRCLSYPMPILSDADFEIECQFQKMEPPLFEIASQFQSYFKPICPITLLVLKFSLIFTPSGSVRFLLLLLILRLRLNFKKCGCGAVLTAGLDLFNRIELYLNKCLNTTLTSALTLQTIENQ